MSGAPSVSSVDGTSKNDPQTARLYTILHTCLINNLQNYNMEVYERRLH